MQLFNFTDSIKSLLNNHLTTSMLSSADLIPLDDLKPLPNKISYDRQNLNSDRKRVCAALKIKGAR
jgi:hypothetical protein